MLVRLFSGFLHPIIHLGFGIEFSQPAIIAEGLAQAAIHDDWSKDLLLPSERQAEEEARREPHPSIVQMLDDIRNDAELRNAPKHSDPNKIRDGLLARAGQRTINNLAKFHVRQEDLFKGTAEMVNTITYCTAGAQRPDRVIEFNFFLLHCLNSSIFFSAFANSDGISQANRVRLLEWKIRMDLIMYASRRSPKLPLEEIRACQPRQPSGWDGIQDQILAYPEDGRACKLIRAIANGERVSLQYENSDATFPLKDQDWIQIGHMAIDSVEAEDEGPEPYVRGAGFDAAWAKFAPRASLGRSMT